MWNSIVYNTQLWAHSFSAALADHPDRSPKKRNHRWSYVREKFLSANPVCAVCEASKNLHVHHIIPFHIMPELELVQSNLITLCNGPGIACHITFGHLGNWKLWNPNILEDVKIWNSKLKHKVVVDDIMKFLIGLGLNDQQKNTIG